MRLLMVYSLFDESDLDMERRFFTISYGNLKKFIDAIRGTFSIFCVYVAYIQQQSESWCLTIQQRVYLEGGEHRDFPPLRLICPP